MRYRTALARFLTVFVSLLIFTSYVAIAASTDGVSSYDSKIPIKHGTVVQLADEDDNHVDLATKSSLQKMLGVVVDKSQLSIALSSEGFVNETFVAVSGTYKVLVSDEGGAIASGDYLTLSSVDGVAMRAGTEESTVLGRANASFDGKGVVLGNATLSDESGQSGKNVKLGTVPITINIVRNPNEKSTKAKVPEVLERIGQAIAEREVSAIRIYLSMAITAVSIISALVILYSGVKNSIVSIGRNPLSKKSIFRALLQVILTSILILIIGLFAVYLLLKL